jgi:NAD-dependent dihydropyrimidine dehydrogenase PreA subunit
MEEWALPEIDLERCTHCGACVRRCPGEAVEMQASGPVIARPQDCTYCALCEALCPEDAIRCTYTIGWG